VIKTVFPVNRGSNVMPISVRAGRTFSSNAACHGPVN
jgi:hypothetical protein